MSWQHFLAMGSYGNYVWTAYALAAAMLIGQALHAFWEHKKLVRQKSFVAEELDETTA